MAQTNFQGLPVAVGLTGTEIVPIQQSGVTKRTTTGTIGQVGVSSALPAAIEFMIDGNGSNISSRVWGYLTVPFNATVTSWSLQADQSGSVIVDVWKCTYAQFDPPTTPSVANSITGSETPTITAASKNRDTSLSTWTTTLAEGDVLAFSVPSPSTSITRVTLTLALTRVVS